MEVAENKFKTEPNGEFTSETKTKVYISYGNSRKRVIAKGLIIGKLDDSGSQIEAKLIVANGWPLTKDAQPKPVKTEDGVIYTFVYTGEVAATPTRQKKENKDKAS